MSETIEDVNEKWTPLFGIAHNSEFHCGCKFFFATIEEIKSSHLDADDMHLQIGNKFTKQHN
jgi:hypothetical protein